MLKNSAINGSFISEDLVLVLTIFQIKSMYISMFGPTSFKILKPPQCIYDLSRLETCQVDLVHLNNSTPTSSLDVACRLNSLYL